MLHIDVDFYQPTFFSLEKFYPKVIDGGWIIIDDYNVEIFDCKKAVDEFRTINNISDKLIKLGNYQVGWKNKHLNVLY